MSNSSEPGKSLFAFIKNPTGYQNSSNLPILRSSISAALKETLSATTFAGGGSAEAEKFRDEVTKVATSDALLEEVSRDIGTPKANETEEEFVKRGSAVFRARLEKTLSKK